MTQETHALERTSPKGQPFVGVCIKCGATGLPITAARQKCENPANLTQSETLSIVLRDEKAIQ